MKKSCVNQETQSQDDTAIYLTIQMKVMMSRNSFADTVNQWITLLKAIM